MQAVSTPAIPAIAPGSLEEYEIPESSEDDIPLSPTHSEQKRRLRSEIKRGLSKIERFYRQSLRGKQCQVFGNLYKGKSVVLRAPTGWGKSRIFQGFRLMLQKDKDCRDPLRDPITIIFTPLLGLGDAQVLELNHREPDIAIFLNGNSSSNDLLRVSQGHYRVVYISPETSQTAAVGRALWWNPNFRHLICLVAVDEAHLVDEWYDISVLVLRLAFSHVQGPRFQEVLRSVGQYS
jgi:superfamily II DNA helicase RecQ